MQVNSVRSTSLSVINREVFCRNIFRMASGYYACCYESYFTLPSYTCETRVTGSSLLSGDDDEKIIPFPRHVVL